jgi:aminoglycoside 6'-N-acetyltransferase I
MPACDPLADFSALANFSLMRIRRVDRADIDRWAMMRTALWPTSSVDEHRQDASSVLAEPTAGSVVLVAEDSAGALCGFAEATLRRDYVNGCETSPVAFLEGIYVEPHHRDRGVGRDLCAAVEAWGRERECSELASDALLENADSHAFHGAIGFEETERVIYFRKRL